MANLEAPQEPGPAERQQAAIEPAYRLVEVGNDDDERGGLAVDFGDADQPRIDEKAQVPAEFREIRRR